MSWQRGSYACTGQLLAHMLEGVHVAAKGGAGHATQPA